MSVIHKLHKSVLKIVYEYYVEQNPTNPLSIDDILSRIENNASLNELNATLNYLTDKEYLTRFSNQKSQSLSYKLTPKGIDYYESDPSIQDDSSPLVLFQRGDLRGQININQYSKDQHSQNNYTGKEFMDQYDTLLHFIDWVRELPVSKTVEEELEAKCDTVEALIRSHDLSSSEK